MNKKIFFWTFLILAGVVWTGSWWLYWIYMGLVHAPGWSEGKLLKISAQIFMSLALLYVIIQGISLKKKGSNFLSTIIRILRTGLGFYCIYFLVAKNLNAKGLDIVFVFILALLSRFIGNKLGLRRPFITLSLVWLFIISINEVIQYFLPFRTGDIKDITSSMIGVAIVLLISRK